MTYRANSFQFRTGYEGLLSQGNELVMCPQCEEIMAAKLIGETGMCLDCEALQRADGEAAANVRGD